MLHHRMILAAMLSAIATAEAAPTALAADAATINVTVTQLHNADGKVWVCLWQDGNAKDFPRCDKATPFAKLSVPASAPKATFADVPPGTYAISMFHDEKGTGVPEVNLLGMPKSGVGTSNNPVLGLMNRPSFDKSRFMVPETKQIEIKTQYLF